MTQQLRTSNLLLSRTALGVVGTMATVTIALANKYDQEGKLTATDVTTYLFTLASNVLVMAARVGANGSITYTPHWLPGPSKEDAEALTAQVISSEPPLEWIESPCPDFGSRPEVTPLGTAPIQILKAFRYYQKLPHQDAAVAWLHQQQSDVILKEFARRWRENPNPVATVTRVAKTTTVLTPPPPKTGPLTLAGRIIAYCEDKGYQIDRGREEKNLIYVEGMNPNGELNLDQFNIWNDARLVIEFEGNTPKIIGAWTATTEPGRYYTMRPINAKGAARVAFGQYKSWQVGRHGQADPHEALVQTGGPVKVYRDLNKDGSRSGDQTDQGFFGVNQHWGGDAPNSDIGRWSAGCLVGQSRQGHREFMALCKQGSRYLKNRGYVFRATVIPGDDLFKRYLN